MTCVGRGSHRHVSGNLPRVVMAMPGTKAEGSAVHALHYLHLSQCQGPRPLTDISQPSASDLIIPPEETPFHLEEMLGNEVRKYTHIGTSS